MASPPTTPKVSFTSIVGLFYPNLGQSLTYISRRVPMIPENPAGGGYLYAHTHTDAH